MGLTKNRIKKIEENIGVSGDKHFFLIIDDAFNLIEKGYFKDRNEEKEYQKWRIEQEAKRKPLSRLIMLIYGENDVREHVERFKMAWDQIGTKQKTGG